MIIIPNKILDKLQEKYVFLKMEQEDKDHTLVRICTSWATTDENVKALTDDLYQLMRE